MFGTNPILPAEHGYGKHLKVRAISDTIQGEGPYVGVPFVFIRLAGCNLACTFCDTDFDNDALQHVDKIIEKVMLFSPDYRKLVVITGGEPCRH